MTHPSKPQPKAAIRSLLSYRQSFGEGAMTDQVVANEGALGVSACSEGASDQRDGTSPLSRSSGPASQCGNR